MPDRLAAGDPRGTSSTRGRSGCRLRKGATSDSRRTARCCRDGTSAAGHQRDFLPCRGWPTSRSGPPPAETSFGWDQGTFLTAYQGNRESANDVALEASVVARPLLDLLEVEGAWSGTASELLSTLEGRVSEQVKRQKIWPKNARSVSGHLKRLAPNLRAGGWQVTFHREAKQRLVHIERADSSASAPVESVQRDAGRRDLNSMTHMTRMTLTPPRSGRPRIQTAMAGRRGICERRRAIRLPWPIAACSCTSMVNDCGSRRPLERSLTPLRDDITTHRTTIIERDSSRVPAFPSGAATATGGTGSTSRQRTAAFARRAASAGSLSDTGPTGPRVDGTSLSSLTERANL